MNNDEHQSDYRAAAEGRIGADRMAMGLSIIPDKNRGDMDEVARWRGLKFEEACQLVENRCRRLGKDCQIIFTDVCVEVAPLSWAGSSTGRTLADAINKASLSA